MTADIESLRKLAVAATPGPWRAANGKGSASVTCDECAIYVNVRTCEVDECVDRWQADARFIAAFNPVTAISILDEIERLRGENMEMASQLLDPDATCCADATRKTKEMREHFEGRIDVLQKALRQACDIARYEASGERDSSAVHLVRIAELSRTGE